MSDSKTVSALRTLDLHKLAQSSMKNMRLLDITPTRRNSIMQSQQNNQLSSKINF